MSCQYFSGNRLCFLILLLIFAFLTSSAKAAQRLPKNIQWRATAIFLDEFDTEEKYSIPVKEAVEFISSHSRFKVRFSDKVFDIPHTFTFYDCDIGRQRCVLVNKWDVDPSVWTRCADGTSICFYGTRQVIRRFWPVAHGGLLTEFLKVN